MPSFASSPFEAGAHTAADLEAKTASSASSSTPTLPWTPARRDSYSSMYSSPSSAGSSTECGDSSDEDEAVTPPVSPDLVPTGGTVDLKGKGKQADHDAFHLAALHFSLADVAEDEGEWVQPVPIEAVVPTPVAPSSARGTPAPSTTVAAVAKPAAPDPHAQAAAAVRPAPQPSPPESAAPAAPDDDARGRSRWPRLLWRSELDVDSLVVLRDYHERAIGEPLPVLRHGMQPREVARWSRRMEDAGL